MSIIKVPTNDVKSKLGIWVSGGFWSFLKQVYRPSTL